MAKTIHEAIAAEQEVTPLHLARALRQQQYQLNDAHTAVNRARAEVEMLMDEAYKLAGYEKKASGGYGPVEEPGG